MARIVVKVGTSTLTHANGRLDFLQMERLVRQISDLSNMDHEVVLVSSGAVGAGMGKLGLNRRPDSIAEKQAVAAVGQGLLMQVYEKLFSEYGQTTAQVLLTRADLMARDRYLNARHALQKLLDFRVIPVINENDTVAVDELCFGDNDCLSALVAALVDADRLIILSDVDGMYSKDPHRFPDAEILSEVATIDEALFQAAGGSSSKVGTGGMITKLQAAQTAVACGITVHLTNGRTPDVLRRILAGERVGTTFLPSTQRIMGKKRWLAFYQEPQGKVRVDQGAREALLWHGKSLLPSGVVGVEGEFDQGDLVLVVDEADREIGRGLVNYSAAEVARIMGLKTHQLGTVLEGAYYDEVIHRDNLVIVPGINGERHS
ncbi:MAG TPA: glutamate 5-kinase [Firmicutes bacterium]|jgi:glutamate 5-kinase|nr:glutamate 5-kinase [Bacillota bacterium]